MTNEKRNGTSLMGENTPLAPEEAVKNLELVARVVARRSLACEIGDPKSPFYRDEGFWEQERLCNDQGHLLDAEAFMKNIAEDPELANVCAWVEEVAIEAFQAGIKFMIPALQEAQASHLPAEEV